MEEVHIDAVHIDAVLIEWWSLSDSSMFILVASPHENQNELTDGIFVCLS